MKLTYEKSWYYKAEMPIADSCVCRKRWLLRAPDCFSNRHSPPSEAGLVNSAEHIEGSGAALLS